MDKNAKMLKSIIEAEGRVFLACSKTIMSTILLLISKGEMDYDNDYRLLILDEGKGMRFLLANAFLIGVSQREDDFVLEMLEQIRELKEEEVRKDE